MAFELGALKREDGLECCMHEVFTPKLQLNSLASRLKVDPVLSLVIGAKVLPPGHAKSLPRLETSAVLPSANTYVRRTSAASTKRHEGPNHSRSMSWNIASHSSVTHTFPGRSQVIFMLQKRSV